MCTAPLPAVPSNSIRGHAKTFKESVANKLWHQLSWLLIAQGVYCLQLIAQGVYCLQTES